jgi:hypothetical protein
MICTTVYRLKRDDTLINLVVPPGIGCCCLITLISNFIWNDDTNRSHPSQHSLSLLPDSTPVSIKQSLYIYLNRPTPTAHSTETARTQSPTFQRPDKHKPIWDDLSVTSITDHKSYRLPYQPNKPVHNESLLAVATIGYPCHSRSGSTPRNGPGSELVLVLPTRIRRGVYDILHQGRCMLLVTMCIYSAL